MNDENEVISYNGNDKDNLQRRLKRVSKLHKYLKDNYVLSDNNDHKDTALSNIDYCYKVFYDNTAKIYDEAIASSKAFE